MDKQEKQKNKKRRLSPKMMTAIVLICFVVMFFVVGTIVQSVKISRLEQEKEQIERELGLN